MIKIFPVFSNSLFVFLGNLFHISLVKNSGAEPIPIKPLIRDLIIEGLSLARTQREEFNSIIINNDGDVKALFTNLTEFNRK